MSFLLFGSPAIADWPTVRGDAASSGVAAVALPDEPALLWTYRPEPATAFEATPVIAAGVAYAPDADGTVHAVRLADGSVVWKRTFAESVFLAGGVIDGETLFVGDAEGVVRALDVSDGDGADGATRWEFAAEGEVYAAPLVHETAAGGRLVLVTTELGRLDALDAATGEERWRFTIADPLRCSPTVVNGHALLAGCDGKLHAIRLTDGAEAGATDIGGPTGCTAAVRDGVAYFGTESGAFYAVDATDPTAPRVAWTYRDPRRGQGVRSAAAVTADAVVYGSQGKAVYRLDPADGSAVWTKRLRSRVEAPPLVLAPPGGAARALVGTTRGRVLLLDLADGATVWEFEAGGAVIAGPAAAAGRVLIATTDGAVYCFGQAE